MLRAVRHIALLLAVLPAAVAAQTFPDGSLANFRSIGCDTPLTATCAYGWFTPYDAGNPSPTHVAFTISVRPHSNLRIRAVGVLRASGPGVGGIADYGGLCTSVDIPQFACSISGPDHLFMLGDYRPYTELSIGIQYFAADAPSINPVSIGSETLTLQRVVPEPGTYALLGTGLLALGGMAARRRRPA